MRAAYPEALLVHRLDRETSGVMVFARTRLAQRHLGWQFERRQVAKIYVARVAGEVAGEAGRIDLPLACDWPNRPRQMVCHAPRQAGGDRLAGASGARPGRRGCALRPLTGRSHQLRVHLAALGHPILGDPLLRRRRARRSRLQLHAARLGFRHPDGGAWVEFARGGAVLSGEAAVEEAGRSDAAVRVRVTGVQGVSYRAFTREEARRRGVCGWVRNEPDGSVTALLAGELGAVRGLIEAMRAGPRGAAVERLVSEPSEAAEAPAGFEIRW